MKKFKLFFLSFGIIILLAACQQEFDSETKSIETNEGSASEFKTRNAIEDELLYMPLDSVPEWVKEKVSNEEYELWKTMSSRYRIDYTFVKENMSNKRRKQVYDCVRSICERIRNGEIREKGGLFMVASEQRSNFWSNWRMERLATPEDDNITTKNVVNELYRHTISDAKISDAKIRVMLSLDYTLNLDDGMVVNMISSVYIDANPAFNATYAGTHNCVFNTTAKIIKVSCGGTVRWSIGSGGESKDFSKTLDIIP